jgi:hypothetical protein
MLVKSGWFTADNASNNDTSMKAFGDTIDPMRLRWDPVQRRVRFVYCPCMLSLFTLWDYKMYGALDAARLRAFHQSGITNSK